MILLVAPHERRVRIAVGYGLEKALPDAVCGQVMDRAILPALSRGETAAGIEAGVAAIIGRLQRR